MIDLDIRLRTCADLVRGDKVSDIGTDHGYIPIYLVGNGIVKSAVASDINEGPAAKALENVRKYALADKINVICTPGLESDAFEGSDTIIIAGMGGELIASIIDESEYPKAFGTRLVLQPMTKAECLRSYLWDNGFVINDDICVKEGKRLYQVLSAEYSGKKTDYNDAQALVGLARKDECYRELVLHNITKLTHHAEAKKTSGHDVTHEERLISLLEELI